MRTNGNGEGPALPSPKHALRLRIFSVLAESKTSAEDDMIVLRQCASHIRNRPLVEEIAKACKMKLSDFDCGEDLELYYNIKRGAQDIGYICKGWEDPGFRIGDTISVPKSGAARFKTVVAQIRKLCAVNGIGITIERSKRSIEIALDGVIYSDGFNKKTFKQTIETLNEVVCEIKKLIQ